MGCKHGRSLGNFSEGVRWMGSRKEMVVVRIEDKISRGKIISRRLLVRSKFSRETLKIIQLKKYKTVKNLISNNLREISQLQFKNSKLYKSPNSYNHKLELNPNHNPNLSLNNNNYPNLNLNPTHNNSPPQPPPLHHPANPYPLYSAKPTNKESKLFFTPSSTTSPSIEPTASATNPQ